VARRLDILFAAEHLVPTVGGAELQALELLAELAKRHRVRAAWIAGSMGGGWRHDELPPGVEGTPAPAPPGEVPYWENKARRRRVLADVVALQISAARPDVVVTQLHGAPAALGAGVPGVLLMPSYEALCKNAFDAGSDCTPAHDCQSCPLATRLPAGERNWMFESRREHEKGLARAAAVAVVGPAVAQAFSEWTGRKPDLELPPVFRLPAVPAVGPDPGGHAVIAAARWSENKGVALLPALAEALAPREVRITEDGLGAQRERLHPMGNVRIGSAPLPELLAGAAVLLVPSRSSEGVPRVAFEAMAAGVPVVAAAVGGLRGLVPDDWLVAPDAPASEWGRRVATVTAGGNASSARARAPVAAALARRPVDALERLLVEAAGQAAWPSA
jgi:glycosyltransferase involved in cell wall biosynthesis